MTSPRASDLELKIPIEGGNASPFDFGENVVAVHFESSYSKQGHEQMQSSDFEVEKTIGTDLNQRSMRLTGQQEVIKYRREVSYGSFRNLLREIDDQRSVDLDYPELCGLFSRKEKWNRLNLKNQLSMGVFFKRKKKSKNENGGGHPFKHRRKKEALTKSVKLNCFMWELVIVIWQRCS